MSKYFPDQFDEKSIPVSADALPLSDSASGGAMKKVLWSTIADAIADAVGAIDLSSRLPVFAHEYKTAAFTAAFAHAYRMSGTFTVTLPSANNEGERILLVNVGSGIITLDAGTDTINGQLGSTLQLVGGESIIFEGTNTTDWIVY